MSPRGAIDPTPPPLERVTPVPVEAPPRPAVTRSADDAQDRLSEAGAAERFARLHGHDVRYDHQRGRWLFWDRHHWTPDSDARVTRLALDFARAWQRESIEIADSQRKEATFKWAFRLERRDTMGNMLALARALKPIAEAGDAWDRDPWLLGVPTGAINLRTGARLEGRREDFITMQTAAPYDPDARCPRWERFIAEVFNGDVDLIGFIHRAIGYSLTGITSEQVLFLCYGTGANGKGTMVNTLKWVLGDYGWNMPFTTIEIRDRAAIPNDLAALVNRRFVVASETNDGTRLNESRVKALTGCDPVTARFLRGEFFTFEPVAKFWLAVNHKPVVRDDSYGFWRRLRLIPFLHTFAINQGLAAELRAEAPGILTWCVRGCLAWQRDGLNAPDVVTTATREYEQDSDPLAAFLMEGCELEPAETAGATELFEQHHRWEVGATELFDHYRTWAERRGYTDRERLSVTAFGRKVKERLGHERTRAGIVYLGVARRAL